MERSLEPERQAALLSAVETLRAAFPPASDAAHPPDTAVANLGDRRDTAVRALRLLGATVLGGAPLLPMQLEVVLHQLVHILGVARGWDASGGTESVLAAAVRCVGRLLRAPGVADVLGEKSAWPAACALAEELLAAANAARSGPLRAAAIRCVWRLSSLDLPRTALGFILPGLASRLCALGAKPAPRAHTPTLVACLGAIGTALVAVLADAHHASIIGDLSPNAEPSPAETLAIIAAAARARGTAPAPAPAPTPAPPQQQRSAVRQQFHVAMDAEWLRVTDASLAPLLRALCAAAAASGPRARRCASGEPPPMSSRWHADAILVA